MITFNLPHYIEPWKNSPFFFIRFLANNVASNAANCLTDCELANVLNEWCKKENVEMIYQPIDYSKPFKGDNAERRFMFNVSEQQYTFLQIKYSEYSSIDSDDN